MHDFRRIIKKDARRHPLNNKNTQKQTAYSLKDLYYKSLRFSTLTVRVLKFTFSSHI